MENILPLNLWSSLFISEQNCYVTESFVWCNSLLHYHVCWTPGVPLNSVIHSAHFVFRDYSMKLLPESNDITGLSNHFELSCWLRIVVWEITLNPLVINPCSRFTWLIRTDRSLLYSQPTKHSRQLGCLTSQAVFLLPSPCLTLSNCHIDCALVFRETNVGRASGCQVLGFCNGWTHLN
jgi:hypothetical protein